MKKLLTIAAVLAAAMTLSAAKASAELSPKYPCSNSMVLQQQASALVWGHGDPGRTVSVHTSWDGKNYAAEAGADGVWKVYVNTPSASYEHHTVSVKCGKEAYDIEDVLIGEVWVASGQSNMEMPLRGYFNCPVEGSNYVNANPAGADKVRMFTVGINPQTEPVSEVEKTRGWEKASPGAVSEMSATAYFFAEQLNRTLDVPVGILALPRGGSRVESWLPRATVEGFGTENCDPAHISATEPEYTRPYVMYDGMEQPVKGYTARGFIWYQGCSNVGKHAEFVPRMKELVRQWREDWGDRDNSMPFYQVEIAPYNYGGDQDGMSAELRAAQHEAAARIPNGGIICTNDLVHSYEIENIHPCMKRPVGLRLAYMALNRDYGFTHIACSSPEAVSVEKDASRASVLLVTVTGCTNGLNRTREIEGLEIAGSDGIFHPVREASMEWGDGRLAVSSPDVTDPVCVRDGWGDFVPGNLGNAEGLPFVPFRLQVNQ